MPQMKSFFYSVDSDREFILTGEQLTAAGEFPVRFQLDNRSAKLADAIVVSLLHVEYIEDAEDTLHTVKVYGKGKKETAPAQTPVPPAPQPTQLQLDFSPKPAPEPAPAPAPADTPPTSADTPTWGPADETFLVECHRLQLALYGEQWVQHQRDIGNVWKR